MRRLRFVLLAWLIAACGSGQVASPTAVSSPLVAVPTASGGSAVSPIVNPVATPLVGPGEPWLAIQRVTGAGGGIFLMRPDGSGLHQLAGSVPGVHKHPDWSPDGNQLAFVVEDDIWTVGADGSNATKLVTCAGGCDNPAWSPDGARLAYAEYESKPGVVGPAASAIRILDLAAGTTTTAIRAERPTLVDAPRWSPDGKRLAVGVDQMDTNAYETGAAVAIGDIAKSSMKIISPFSSFLYATDWSPMGDRIVASVEVIANKQTAGPSDGTWNLYLISPTRTQVTRLTDVPAGTRLWNPTWTPDGSRILAGDMGSFTGVTVDPNNGTVEPLALTSPVPFQFAHPRLRPNA
ncbi:MAG TPA: hypothetical protein VGQ85_00875 [Candidatus Limnocylindrales bacterium]|nr:hypothetical protein [Candidatus Limnocylindrales bacterium]